MKKKSLREWVRENRQAIEAVVLSRPGAKRPTNDDEREDWVLNDESLYKWAQSAGVDV